MGGGYKNKAEENLPIWRPSAEEKELMDQLQTKREIKAKYNLLSLNKVEQTDLYKYILLPGNNHDVVRRVLDSRPSWCQIKSSQTLYQFKWAQVSRQIRFDFLSKHGQRNLVNKFENHGMITTKDQLCHNLSRICEATHQDVYNYLPVTFVIDLGSTACQTEFDKFCRYFNTIEKAKQPFSDAGTKDAQAEVLSTLNKHLLNHVNMGEKKRTVRNATLRDSMFDGQNIWLLKPADANRGRGVQLFSSIEQLKRLILELTTVSKPESKVGALGQATPKEPLNGSNLMDQSVASQDASTATSEKPHIPGQSNVKSDIFVVQKYIEKPLLINRRKFDIRLWVLVTHEHKCFYFREGYCRLSGQPYTLENQENLFVHLTNNAIQKHGENYGAFEEGNILSFQ